MTDTTEFPATLTAAAAALRARTISPLELLDATLARIRDDDPYVNAFVTLTHEQARRQATVAQDERSRGVDRGPLHGIPFTLKDIYHTAGIRTSAHSFVLRDWIPQHDAHTVTRMYAAGAVLLGKVATIEFATGAATEGPWPAARNPWNVDYTPFGSSSGSGVAVACRFGFASLGSDTGGSIRHPAAANGCVGIRPTYGRVSKRGVEALSWSLDTSGPLAPVVADCALVLQEIAGYDPLDPGSADVAVPDFSAQLGRSLQGVRVGIDRSYFFSEFVDPEAIAAVEAAIGVMCQAGATLKEVHVPELEYATDAQNVIHMAESHSYHAKRIRAVPELYGPTVRAYFRVGAFVSGPEYLAAQRVRNQVRAALLSALQDVDVLVSPTLAKPFERFDAVDTGRRFDKRAGRGLMSVPFSQAGMPAISVPCGFGKNGLPLGLQIAGRPFDEAGLLGVAAAYERETPWHTMRPPRAAAAV